jgi:hypothetical protein
MSLIASEGLCPLALRNSYLAQKGYLSWDPWESDGELTPYDVVLRYSWTEAMYCSHLGLRGLSNWQSMCFTWRYESWPDSDSRKLLNETCA